MTYFRERARPALAGLVIGLLLGWLQPVMLGVKAPEPAARLFMTLQMGLAFTMVGLFLASYLQMRRRAISRYGKSKPR
jgi:hypothetical protein